MITVGNIYVKLYREIINIMAISVTMLNFGVQDKNHAIFSEMNGTMR